MEFRDLGAQYRALKPQIDAAVAEVLASGRFIGGAPVRELEERLADYVGVRHCITCANGTDALQLALMAWGIGPGDAVFVPDFTFFSSGEVVAAVGATPVFVDVDERTFNIDPTKLEKAICAVQADGRLHPRAVMAVDLFGLPVNFPAICRICVDYGLLLLEDGAQGFGGSVCVGQAYSSQGHGGSARGRQVHSSQNFGEFARWRRACSFGDVSTTSFFPAKPLGCYGDGGAVFADDDEWAALVRSLAVHGRGSSKYDNVRIGMNSRLDAIQAAVLLAKLEAFDSRELEDVARVADWYDAALEGSGLVLPERLEGFRSSWAQYTVQLPGGVDRNAVQSALKERGVPAMVYYPKPLHEQPAFAGACEVPVACSVSERLCKRVLSLPMGPYMEQGDVQAVADALLAALASEFPACVCG